MNSEDEVSQKKIKWFDVILKLSFITYYMAIYASPYVTAQLWADFFFSCFLLALLYQVVYLFVLRKKYGLSFLSALTKFFFYVSVTLSIYIVFFYFFIFFNGYSYYFFTVLHGPFYGLEAWKNSAFVSMFYIPVLVFSFIYEICFYFYYRKKRSKEL